MEINPSTTTLAPAAESSSASAISELTSDDFLGLLIAQLRTQDPLDPMDNDDLLRQISTIRDIELSSALTSTLQDLAGQQQFGSMASLIGQFVTAASAADGTPRGGVVVGVRFSEQGEALLQLSDGSQVPTNQVLSIESAEHAGAGLVGKLVSGVDGRDPSDAALVEGVVTGVRTDTAGVVLLELDTGQSLRLRDVVGVRSTDLI